MLPAAYHRFPWTATRELYLIPQVDGLLDLFAVLLHLLVCSLQRQLLDGGSLLSPGPALLLFGGPVLVRWVRGLGLGRLRAIRLDVGRGLSLEVKQVRLLFGQRCS